MQITGGMILEWLRRTASELEVSRDYLTQLDAEIGDADHGINMDRGFKKVLSILADLEEEDIGTILERVGMALISSVGGASGPLYGTFFLRAAGAARGKGELSQAELAQVLRAGVEGVVQRGKAERGDKTMLDALLPALEAFSAGGGDARESLARAAAAAEKGMAATIPLQARKGRASYLAERSIGHQDPGATSAYMMLRALAEVVSSEPTRGQGSQSLPR